MAPIKSDRQECTVYSRVCGWYTPVKCWNKGKQSEYDDRVTYSGEVSS